MTKEREEYKLLRELYRKESGYYKHASRSTWVDELLFPILSKQWFRWALFAVVVCTALFFIYYIDAKATPTDQEAVRKFMNW